MSDFDYPDYDDDDRPTCDRCGAPLTSDEDGDGVMTAPVYFCDECGDEPPECPEGEHEWESHQNPSTPDNPAENVCYCKKCGKEKTE